LSLSLLLSYSHNTYSAYAELAFSVVSVQVWQGFFYSILLSVISIAHFVLDMFWALIVDVLFLVPGAVLGLLVFIL